ncbi:5-formyltetrahydrofolate cyclo-ligase [Xanthobacter sp. ZOL 2024]
MPSPVDLPVGAAADGEASRAEKARLRARALAQRAEMGVVARSRASAQAAWLATSLLGRDGDLTGRRIALFASFRDEIDTLPLARELWSRNAQLALPVIVDRGVPLLFRYWAEGAALAPQGAFAIPTPGPECAQLEPEVVLVPLAAFDRRGLRIGYGAGFYDRTLARLREAGPLLAVGFAFACQEVERVPAEPHDEPVDVMVTEAEVIPCSGR